VVNALDLYSGRKIWEYRPDLKVHTEGRPFVGDKYIYFHGGDIYTKTSYIYALDKENGTLKWEFELDIPYSRRVNIREERLFFSGSGKEDPTESYIVCIDLKTREELWKYYLPESPVGIGLASRAPIVAGDTLFWLSPDNYLYAIEIAEGRQKWRYKAPMGVSSFALKGNLAFICSKGIYAIDIRDGRLLWQFAPGVLFSSNLCFVGDVGYVGAFDGHVYALNLEDGKKLWYFEIGGYITSISAIDSILAVISSARDLYILGDRR
jgi:outer membrane protein assembly factor BamB